MFQSVNLFSNKAELGHLQVASVKNDHYADDTSQQLLPVPLPLSAQSAVFTAVYLFVRF